jgi:8-oxo-dGTP pyrophosphatase MutT (NUDIX family)
MSKITREWQVVHAMPEDNLDLPIRQVYTWIFTRDKQVVIVSKDGERWQLPGGKPDRSENALETAVREVQEETSINIRPYIDALNFFGVYTIKDLETDIHPPEYRQIRAWLELPIAAADLHMSTVGEPAGQRPEDAVCFVKAVPIEEVLSFIPWLEKTDEYKALKRNGVIDRANLGNK